MNEIKLKRFSADYCNPHSFRMVETIDGPWCHYAEVSRLLDVLVDQLRRSEAQRIQMAVRCTHLDTCLREGHHFGRYAHEEANYEEPEVCTRCGYVETEEDLRRQEGVDSLEQQEHLVATFNGSYPVGTEVYFWNLPQEAARPRRSRTRTVAQILFGRAVVWLVGQPGCWDLSHVRPVPPGL